jgi:NADPH:quinone reductase-like Zn-dependent oxidoreductase
LDGELPQGMGIKVFGVVDEVSDEVTDVTAGDEVFGPTWNGAADFACCRTISRSLLVWVSRRLLVEHVQVACNEGAAAG